MLHLHSKLTCERKGTEGRLPHSIHAFIFFSGESQIFPLPGETDVKLYSARRRNSAYVKKHLSFSFFQDWSFQSQVDQKTHSIILLFNK